MACVDPDVITDDPVEEHSNWHQLLDAPLPSSHLFAEGGVPSQLREPLLHCLQSSSLVIVTVPTFGTAVQFWGHVAASFHLQFLPPPHAVDELCV
jgi:hypothetical protein